MAATAHAASPSLPLRPKLAASVDWVKPLTMYVKEKYSKEEADTMKDTLERMNRLRKSLQDGSVKTEDALGLSLWPYIALTLRAIMHFPIGSSSVKLSFKWSDGLIAKKSHTTSSGHYEALAWTYNAACVISALAAGQTAAGTAEGTKAAFRLFQLAAGYFEWMSEYLLPRLEEVSTPDLTKEGLQFGLLLNIAEAQRSSYVKAASDEATGGKHTLLAKLAADAARSFADARTLTADPALKDTVAPVWPAYTVYCEHLLNASAHGHVAADVHAKDVPEIGIEIGHLQVARSLCDQALQQTKAFHPTPPAPFEAYARQVDAGLSRALAVAVQENSKVYHDPVKQPSAPLPTLGKALGKATPFDFSKYMEPKDPFQTLVPLPVLEAAETFQAELSGFVQETYNAVVMGREQVARQVEGLGLSRLVDLEAAAIKRLPQQLQSRVESVQRECGAAGAGAHLLEKIQMLRSQSSSVQSLLGEVENQLKAEQEEDTAARGQQALARVEPSDRASEALALRQAVADVRARLAALERKDSALDARVQSNGEHLERLDIPVDDINQAIREDSPDVAGVHHQIESDLRVVRNRMMEVEGQLRETLQEFMKKPDAGTVVEKILPLTVDEHRDRALAELKAPYEEKQRKLMAAIQEVRALAAQMEEYAGEFRRVQQEVQVNQTQQRVAQRLEVSATLYSELCISLQGNSSTYGDLADTAARLRARAGEFREGRRKERELGAKQQQLDATLDSKTAELEAAVREMEAQQEQQRKAAEERRKKLSRELAMQEMLYRQQVPPAQPQAPSSPVLPGQATAPRHPQVPVMQHSQQMPLPSTTPTQVPMQQPMPAQMPPQQMPPQQMPPQQMPPQQMPPQQMPPQQMPPQQMPPQQVPPQPMQQPTAAPPPPQVPLQPPMQMAQMAQQIPPQLQTGTRHVPQQQMPPQMQPQQLPQQPQQMLPQQMPPQQMQPQMQPQQLPQQPRQMPPQPQQMPPQQMPPQPQQMPPQPRHTSVPLPPQMPPPAPQVPPQMPPAQPILRQIPPQMPPQQPPPFQQPAQPPLYGAVQPQAYQVPPAMPPPGQMAQPVQPFGALPAQPPPPTQPPPALPDMLDFSAPAAAPAPAAPAPTAPAPPPPPTQPPPAPGSFEDFFR